MSNYQYCSIHKNSIWSYVPIILIRMRPEQVIVRVLFILFLLLPPTTAGNATGDKRKVDKIDVGVILNLDSSFGIVSNCCITMAFHDIHAAGGSGSGQVPRLALHLRDSGSSDMGAASAGFDLLQNVGVQAIIGAQLTSNQAELLGHMSNQAHVPIISLLTSTPLLSSSPYLMGIDARDTFQASIMTALAKAYNWKEVILIHDNTHRGTSLIPYLIHDLYEARMKHVYAKVVASSASDSVIHRTLQEIAAMKTKVFLVHTSFSLAVGLFRQAHELGMMSEGYVWIITSRIANLLNHIDPATMETMQGILGLRNNIPKHSVKFKDFEVRWKRKMRREHPELDVSELDVYTLWAYDSMLFVAKAAQREDFLHGNESSHSSTSLNRKSAANLFDLAESSMGRMLLESMLATQFKGLSGEVVRNVEGQFALSDVFEIVNIAGKAERRVGYWTQEFGLCRNLSSVKDYSADAKDLAGVVWPGGVVLSPRRRLADARLKVGVPIKDGYYEYVKVDNTTGIPTGFSIDVFKYVMKALAIDIDWEPYPRGDGHNYYDRLIQQVVDKKYDVVVGDVTITAQRAKEVDYSQPYADSDMVMIVPANDENDTNNPAWFLKPVSPELWGATLLILVLKGVLVFFFERTVKNAEYSGTIAHQLGKILSLSFATFVFADQEKLKSNYSRFIVSLWIIIVFILITGYTANLTSMLTVQRLVPKVTDLQTLIDENQSIGYQGGSFVEDYLKRRGAKHIHAYSTDVEYSQALSNKSVAAIVDEMPYIRVFLSRHPDFGIADRINHTGGLGFVFQKNSTLVSRVSEALLKLRESEDMCQIERKWFGNDTCSTAKQDASVSNSHLTLRSFRWLYIFTVSASALAFFAFLAFSPTGEGARIALTEARSDPSNPEDQLPNEATGASQPAGVSVAGQGRQEVALRRLESGQGSLYDTASESDDNYIMEEASTPSSSHRNLNPSAPLIPGRVQ